MQIADNISEKVIKGKHSPGQKIPSVRELAADVGVNPNTVMRTYSELQNLGVIENKRGIGYFVTDAAPDIIIQQKKKEFFEHELPQLYKKMKILGINYEELKQYLNKLNGELK
ncbi:MAG: GntR family transcriptional regulator [Candidatus Cyclobacteriaceae bacterium M3_2C_046]